MRKTSTKLPEMALVGVTVRTSNQQEFDKANAKIPPCVMRYFHQALFNKIPHRKRPGTTICAYTDYESDHTGQYTYFIGEEVTGLEHPLPDGFQTLVIPGQQYMKLTTNPGPMPDVCVTAWQGIWKMSPKELGGKRRYATDFELYDERASDHHNVVLDIYIGIHD